MAAKPAALVVVAGLVMALSGFLLFQVQPMMARYILPWFGGSATTWTVCLLFFQVGLLLGYAYAHYFTRPLRPKTQIAIHLAIIALSLASLPITPADSFKPADANDPTLRILILLARNVGLPYLVLSTTTPLVQKWLAAAGSATPSRLFALSNFGSLLGLVSYPPLVDLYLPTDQQTWWWSFAYVIYAVSIAVFGLLTVLTKAPTPATATTPDSTVATAARSAPGGFGLWFTLAALGSVSLLAITNYITTYVSVNPFLWILPLSVYLLSFVIAFARPGWYRPVLFGSLYAAALAFNFFTATQFGIDNAFGVIAVNLGCFAVCCLICQGELARRQPAPEGLTFFYLALAAGGAAGGVLVTLVAPVIFPAYWELPLGMIGVGVLQLALNRPAPGWGGVVRPRSLAITSGCVLAAGFAIYAELFEGGRLIDRHRNFYGVLKVEEWDAGNPRWDRYVMRQAGENQGEQLKDPNRRNLAACDFSPSSGIGHAISYLQQRSPTGIRIGVIGLGAGMILTQGRSNDSFRYYELNPAVTAFARKHFTFLADTKSAAEVIEGDGRLSLERELKTSGPRNFDLLHIDAFRGNAPPSHLMTKEAFEIYFQHLRPGGILAVTSHRDYYDASSLFRGMADLFAAEVRWFPAPKRECRGGVGFALFSRDPALFADAAIRAREGAWDDNATTKTVWTDQKSSLMSLLVWSG